jgi:hypothetical protein
LQHSKYVHIQQSEQIGKKFKNFNFEEKNELQHSKYVHIQQSEQIGKKCKNFNFEEKKMCISFFLKLIQAMLRKLKELHYRYSSDGSD